MLLRFGVSNHLSFCERQEISLIPSSSIKESSAGLIPTDASPEGAVLPVAVIYGANASGKSNLVSAIHFFQDAIASSQSGWRPMAAVPQRVFLLNPFYRDKISRYDADFVHDGVRYSYEFEILNGEFSGEAMYAYPLGRRRVLFERRKSEFTFGSTLRGAHNAIEKLVRPNSLFLSAALQNNHDQLAPTAESLMNIGGHSVMSPDPYNIAERFSGRSIDSRIITFLKSIGTGVVGYSAEPLAMSGKEMELRDKLIGVLSEFVQKDVGPFDLPPAVKLAHEAVDGTQVYLGLERESAGTRRLITVLDVIFTVLDAGGTCVIDELGAHLHTKACEALLALFFSKDTNPRGAQLIATTHDTNLLRADYLRRDQIWFTEKNSVGASTLYPLTDIRVRRSDNLEEGYLSGRYGAVPFAGGLDNIRRFIEL